MLWLCVDNPEEEAKVQEVLVNFGVEVVRAHEIERRRCNADLPLLQMSIDPWLGSEPLAHDCAVEPAKLTTVKVMGAAAGETPGKSGATTLALHDQR